MVEQESSTVEEWRPVVGYEGYYSVSNLGRVRRDMPCQGTRAGNVLGFTPGTDGYLYATLSRNSVGARHSVQSLLMAAFVGPCPVGHNINHEDGVKTNNRLSNLTYATFSRNSKHAFETGLSPRGEQHGFAKLTDEQVRDIKKVLRNCPRGTQSALARQYSVNETVISKIKRGKIWTHIA